MVDLPLIDEDTCVLWNEVAIQRCVFRGAEKKKTQVWIYCKLVFKSLDIVEWVLCGSMRACHYNVSFSNAPVVL